MFVDQWRKQHVGLKTYFQPNSALWSAFPSSAADWNKKIQAIPAEITLAEIAEKIAAKTAAAAPAPSPATSSSSLTGSGARLQKGPVKLQKVPFGKFNIALDKLYNESIFSVSMPNTGQKSMFLPNKVVSAAMRVCLLAVVNGLEVPVELLSPEEADWFDWVLKSAKIKFEKKQPDKLETRRTPKQMRERLSVLYGEIVQGPNDNPAIKKEFLTLFDQALLRGVLKDAQIENMRAFIKSF